MSYAASAPGKLVILGEYAVLDGAPALVMAVNRRCRASVRAADAPGELETRQPGPARHAIGPDGSTGVALVDLVTARTAAPTPWRGVLDSSELFGAGGKLGLGSSAAALVAWAGVWSRFAGRQAPSGLDLADLVALHRRFQGGGSGLDVAASLAGGVVTYRLEAGDVPRLGSVRLPNSVGFAGIFAGRPASTPDFVARYGAFSRERPRQAAELRQQLGGVAEVGCEAASRNDAQGLLAAIDEYGRGLAALGQAIGAEIMTREHEAIAAEARRFGLVYKVSGAGGGDLGLAFSDRPDALAAFEAAAGERGFGIVNDLDLDPNGLVVEERT